VKSVHRFKELAFGVHLQAPFQSPLNSPAHILVSRFSLTPSNKRLITRGDSEIKEENNQGAMSS